MNTRIITILAGLALLAAPAHGVLVIDSFAGSTGGASAASGPTASFFFGLSPYPDREAAFTFTTGTTDTYLDELRMSLTIGDNTSALEATLSTGPSAPGGTGTIPLGSYAPASASPTIQTATFTQSPNSILLSANTEYWIHLSVPTGGGIYNITFTDTPAYETGWSLGDTWAFTPASGLPPTGWNQDGTSGVARIQLEVTPVPEPTAALLGGIGLLALLRRRAR